MRQVWYRIVDRAGEDVDDAPAAALLQVRNPLTTHPPEEDERPLHRRLPLLLGGGGRAGQGRAAGVVDQHVDAAELLQRRRNQTGDAFQPVQVSGIGQHLAASGFPDLICSLLQVGRGAAANDDLRALLGQHLRAGPPQPLAGSADDCNLVLQAQIHCNVLIPPRSRGQFCV